MVLQEVVHLRLKRGLKKEEVEIGGQGRTRGFLSWFCCCCGHLSDPAGRGAGPVPPGIVPRRGETSIPACCREAS